MLSWDYYVKTTAWTNELRTIKELKASCVQNISGNKRKLELSIVYLVKTWARFGAVLALTGLIALAISWRSAEASQNIYDRTSDAVWHKMATRKRQHLVFFFSQLVVVSKRKYPRKIRSFFLTRRSIATQRNIIIFYY